MAGLDHEAWALDTYVCEMQYPVAEEYSVGWDGERWAAVYQYWVGTYIPCLTANGYHTEEPPALEDFVERAMKGDVWNPAAQVLSQVIEDVGAGVYGSYEEFDREVCPQSPS